MKRIVYLVLLPFFLFSQSSNWNSTVDLNLSVNYDDRTDIYANKDGIHILVENGSTLRYYLYSTSGSQIRNSTIDGSISSTYSKIAGWDSIIYISYKEGTTIYTKESANAGQSWSTGNNNITMGDSDSDGLELWTDTNGLHLVYSEMGEDEYETFYYRSAHGYSNWTDDKEVSDEFSVNGGMPSITTSGNRIHVGFTQTNDYTYSRDKYSGSWQSSQSIGSWYPRRITLVATSNKLHALYSELHIPSLYLYYQNRNISSTSWSSPTFIVGQSGDAEQSKPEMAVTTNDKMHMVYYYVGDLEYRVWDDSLSSAYDALDIVEAPRITASSNDIFITGITNDGSGGYELKMRQRDYAPLAPQNFEFSDVDNNDHPIFTWDENGEADLAGYNIYRKRMTEQSFCKINSSTITDTSYTDEDVTYQVDGAVVDYYLKAVDNSDNLSSRSDYASCGESMWKRAADHAVTSNKTPDTYFLEPAYPNPFNPLTTIRFGLPKAEEVLLEVYNIHGQLVAILIDGYLDDGYHEVKFNGSQLSSGVYIYKLRAGEFTSIKRMVLVK